MPVPRYHGFFNPALQALRHLGGSASVAEIEEEVIKILGLTDEEVAEPHDERSLSTGWHGLALTSRLTG